MKCPIQRLHTWPDAAVPVSGSIRHDRSNKDAQIKVAHSLLPDYHHSCAGTNGTHLDAEATQSHATQTQLTQAELWVLPQTNTQNLSL